MFKMDYQIVRSCSFKVFKRFFYLILPYQQLEHILVKHNRDHLFALLESHVSDNFHSKLDDPCFYLTHHKMRNFLLFCYMSSNTLRLFAHMLSKYLNGVLIIFITVMEHEARKLFDLFLPATWAYFGETQSWPSVRAAWIAFIGQFPFQVGWSSFLQQKPDSPQNAQFPPFLLHEFQHASLVRSNSFKIFKRIFNYIYRSDR